MSGELELVRSHADRIYEIARAAGPPVQRPALVHQARPRRFREGFDYLGASDLQGSRASTATVLQSHRCRDRMTSTGGCHMGRSDVAVSSIRRTRGIRLVARAPRRSLTPG